MQIFGLTVVAAALLVVGTAPVVAETAPNPGRSDSRVTYATFQPGQVFRVTTRLKHVTLVEVGESERIESVSVGDSASFSVEEISSQNAFIVKPLIAGAVTNATVETNRRFYFLQLQESSRTTPNYSIKFTVPQSGKGKAASEAIPPAQPMRYAYAKQTKGASFRPVRVWDDGRKTYFEFSPDAPIPSVFRADSSGREYTVNTSVKRTRVTVTNRSQRWVLRYGDDYICINGK
ncbi:MAG: TrbG/VirB9 family P-type conjugative transfer protein [Hyphomicrobiaceae bacterium]